MSEEIARQWLEDAMASANNKDLQGHMSLISRRVSLQGMPGYENMGYDDWEAQCKHEFENNVLKCVIYEGFKFIKATGTGTHPGRR